jgi:hypothetical protein
MSRKLTPRQVIARSYPTWDYAMADRLIAWLQDCGYEIVQKAQADIDDVVTQPSDQPVAAQLSELMQACWAGFRLFVQRCQPDLWSKQADCREQDWT